MSVTKLSQSDLLYRFSIPFFTALRHRDIRIRTSPGNVVLILMFLVLKRMLNHPLCYGHR